MIIPFITFRISLNGLLKCSPNLRELYPVLNAHSSQSRIGKPFVPAMYADCGFFNASKGVAGKSRLKIWDKT